MTRRALILGLLSIAACVAAAGAPKVPPEILRYLQAARVGEQFQAGLRQVIANQGSNPFIDRLLAATPRDIEATIAPAYVTRMTAQQARVIADFFNSPAGQKTFRQALEMYAERSTGKYSSDRSIEFTADESRKYHAFEQSPEGKLYLRLGADPDLAKERKALLLARYGK